MYWILIGVIVIALILLAQYKPIWSAILLGVLVLVIALAYFTTELEQKQGRALLQKEEVQVSINRIYEGYANSHNISLRINNLSDSSNLKEVEIRLLALDCAERQELDDCAAIGEKFDRINVRVPAGQSRDIDRNIYAGNLNPTGQLRWKLDINKVVAE